MLGLDTYKNRINARGNSKRASYYRNELQAIYTKAPESLSYQRVIMEGEEQDVVVINSDNLNEKTIIAMPGEELYLGGLVYWMNNYWLISELDANDTIYSKGIMLQCNHLLKWVDDDDIVREQWCVVDDGTKYMTGILTDRDFVTTRGDSRIAVTIGRNEYTVKFNRNMRFLVDDEDSEHKLAYMLSKPMKAGHLYNGRGVYVFVCQEVTATEDDNQELGIADYYKHFPKETYGTVTTVITDADGNKIIGDDGNALVEAIPTEINHPSTDYTGIDKNGREAWL